VEDYPSRGLYRSSAKQFPRKGSRQAPPLDFPKNSLPTFVDEIPQMDRDLYIKLNRTDREPVGHSSRLTGNLPHDAFLKQSFSAATGKAIAILLLLVSYIVLRKIMGAFRLESTTTTQGSPTFVFDTAVEADDDTVAEPPSPGEDSNVDSSVFEDAWLANEFQAPVVAFDAPVGDSDIKPTAFSNNSFWITESQAPVDEHYAPVEYSDVETTAFSEEDTFWTTESQAPVEPHNAPVEDFDVDTSENDHLFSTDNSVVSQIPYDLVVQNTPEWANGQVTIPIRVRAIWPQDSCVALSGTALYPPRQSVTSLFRKHHTSKCVRLRQHLSEH